MRWPQTIVLRALILIAVSLPAWCAGEGDSADPLPHRWVFSFGYGRNREDVETIKKIIATGAEHGLNGVVLSSFGLDSITRWDEEDFALLGEIDAFCKTNSMELVPTGFNVGYSGGALGFDRNFAAALPATIRLEAGAGRAVPVHGDNLLVNGDMEEHEGDRFSGYGFHDRPGEVTFVDADAASGDACIRFENFGSGEHGHGRIMQKVAVCPACSYRFSCRIRTRDLSPVAGFKLMAYDGTRSVAEIHPALESTQDWQEIALEFITTDHEEIHVYAGIWGGRSGVFWLDDLKLQEYGTLGDIVRREGTPLEMRSADRDMAFVEGKDYLQIQNLRNLPQVSLTPDTAIVKGEKLVLSCYKTPYVSHSWGRQISLCMSVPALYEHWERQARRLHEAIGYRKFLLAVDEIRNGGGCLSCRERGMSMGEILGDCITRQREIFRRIDPDIEVLIWSDMLDPAHNARDNYYGVVGDFTGSWNHVPGDLTIMCWHHGIRDDSLAFFSGLDFRTFGAAYYDADDLSNPREWLTSLKRTPGAEGIMYTSWRRKYELLAPFGDLVSTGHGSSDGAK